MRLDFNPSGLIVTSATRLAATSTLDNANYVSKREIARLQPKMIDRDLTKGLAVDYRSGIRAKPAMLVKKFLF